ncbi:MAG: helix-turn-helix domain-containing protein [Candidatus Woesearchaeota archaeon]|jgi:sugar-specific transcriptional regulator TrmB
MEIHKLMQIGLNKNESLVYSALLSLGKASATQIAQRTNLHRAVVYDNLDRLVDKSLATFITEGKKKVFQPNSPEMLAEMLEKQQEELNKKVEIAKEIKKEASQIFEEIVESQDARMLRGLKGIKLLYEDVLNCKSYNSFGAPLASVKIMGETFWKNIDIKTQDRKIKINLIFNESLRRHGEAIKKEVKNIELRFLDHGFDPLTQTIVYGGKVAIIVWTEKPIVTLIHDQYAYDSYNSFFNLLWKIARK